MWKRFFIINLLFLGLSGCDNEPKPYSPPQQVNNTPTCDPDYAHCADQSIHVVSQQINDAL